MRSALLLLALAAFSCASSPVEQCIQLSGTFNATGACTRSAKTAKIWLSDTVIVDNIKSVVVDQSGCGLKLRVTEDDGTSREATLDSDLQWNDIGFDRTWSPTSRVATMLPGATREERTISMKMSEDRSVLTITSAFDHHGLALLFMPFHQHEEATCVFTRAKP